MASCAAYGCTNRVGEKVPGIHFIDALTRAASQNAELLKGAERQLECWETQLGFYSTLLTIASDQSLDINIRWLSVLCTKNGVDKHWRNTITAAEKNVIREKLLSCINEPINQIALQLAVIISKVARYDFPNNWQELFPTLLNGIQSTDQLHHLRALLTGHHVIKALASKRLTFDQKIFQQLTATIFSTIFHQWINYSKLFLEEVQRDITTSSQLLESAFLSLKILRKLVVYGFKDCSKEPDAANFLSLIFQQVGPFLECRSVLLSRDHMLQICEKYVVLLTKVLHDILEMEPYAFVPFLQPSLECSVTFCFNKDFQDHLFERLIIQLLNLIKSILIKDSLKPERWGKDTESRTSLRLQAAKTKSEFFTFPVLSEICQQLISRYFLLSENDLNCWESNPEEFATEEKGDSWKVSLRPSIESLFLTLFREFRSTLTPIVVEMTKNMQTNSTTDLIGILKKDAIYNAVGLAAFDLYDEIDFNNWFTNVLIPELRIKENGYYVIRRRVIWLIGQWVGVKMSPDLRPLLYEMILQCMSTDENLVVRLAAAHTLKVTVDDFEFREEQFYPVTVDYPKFKEEYFYPFLERNLSSLFVLLQQVKECDLKMSVLHVLSFIIERMKSEVEPHVNSLMQYLPQLWESSGDHNMLRCAIVSCFVQLVKSLRRTSEFLHGSLLPMIALCTDVSQPPHVYLLEDGLDLWYAIMANTAISSPELLDLAANLLPLLEYNNESLRMCLQITESYIILSPEIYLKRYGQDLVRIFRSAVTDLKSEGINLILRVVETAFIVFPTDGPLLFQPLLPFVLNLILTPDELPLSLSLYLSMLSRVILHNQSCFVHVLQERANESQKNVNSILRELFDLWLKKMPLMNPLPNRKLMGLALTCLLTSGSEVVHDQICGILLAIIEVLHDVTKCGDIHVDILVLNNSNAKNLDSEDSEPEDNSYQDEFSDFVHENEKRKLQLLKIDPVYTVVLRDFFYKQMMALEQSVGTAKFQDLMSTVDIETMQQVQKYLQNIGSGDQCMKENSM